MGSLPIVVALVSSALIAVSALATQYPENVLPIPDRSTQLVFEQQVADFLAESPGPVQTHPKDGTTASLNSYYEAEVAWWDSVPWEAVVGQWGCTLRTYEANFNPPEQSGVVSARYGVIADCGNALDATGMTWLTSPVTRSSVIDAPVAVSRG